MERSATLNRPVGRATAEARLALDAALARIAGLGPDQAEVILLRVIGDLSVEETARILGKATGRSARVAASGAREAA